MSSSEAVEATLKEVDRVSKKAKTCAARSSDALSKLIQSLEKAQKLVQAASSQEGVAMALRLLQEQAGKLEVAASLASETKELHGAVSKLGKAVDRHFSTDVCKAAREAELDRAALNQVVAEHLFHEGQFEIGDVFVGEAGVAGGEALKAPYASMHAVLQQIQSRNLAPALEWVAAHRSALGGGRPSSFEFSLHKLAFLQALQDDGQSAALAYARRSFPPFAATHMAAIQRLMGALCFSRRAATAGTAEAAVAAAARAAGGAAAVAAGGGGTPYTDLLQLEGLWEGLARDFVRQCCALLGQAQDSPLLVSVAAGSAALPTLLKLAAVRAVQPAAELAHAAASAAGPPLGGNGGVAGAEGEGVDGGQAAEALPVEIPLGREFVFHSIFACPVSREQSSAGNPPWMLPCGHVMCKQSVLKIAKAATRPFKCPYCPAEATPGQCKELVFPDME